MKNSLIIIIFSILFIGCTIPINQPPIEEKKVVVQETGGYEPWPDGEKVYWYGWKGASARGGATREEAARHEGTEARARGVAAHR